LEVDAGVRAFDLYSKRDLCVNVVSQESNVCPRSRVMAASNQNNFFHLFDPQPKLSGEGEPLVDMLYYPQLKITSSKSVFTPSFYWQR
jgi:hypothetical protein